MKYQLFILGPNVEKFDAIHRLGLVRAIRDLKLDPAVDFDFLSEGDSEKVHPKVTPVVLWYGGEDTSRSDFLESLQARGSAVLPLVEDIDRFQSLVPDSLRPINGRQWDNDKIPADVLQAFRLTRDTRQAFLSYKRADSTPVAAGLLDALTARGYRVFLDTASVDAATRFQDVLWDRLADMDLMIFLDSPTALNSRWVNEELTRVNLLGLGILQLIWPAPHKRFKGTELSEPFDLDRSDFVRCNTGPKGRLTEAALARVVAKVEEVRIRSISSRRLRVVRELMDRAEARHYRFNLYPMGPITLRAGLSGSADEPISGVLVPLIGLPDAWSIYQVEKQLMKLMDFEKDEDFAQIARLIEAGEVRLVYDGLGVQAERAEHHIWLNKRLVLKTAHFDRAVGPEPDPLEQFLERLGRTGTGGVA